MRFDRDEYSQSNRFQGRDYERGRSFNRGREGIRDFDSERSRNYRGDEGRSFGSEDNRTRDWGDQGRHSGWENRDFGQGRGYGDGFGSSGAGMGAGYGEYGSGSRQGSDFGSSRFESGRGYGDYGGGYTGGAHGGGYGGSYGGGMSGMSGGSYSGGYGTGYGEDYRGSRGPSYSSGINREYESRYGQNLPGFERGMRGSSHYGRDEYLRDRNRGQGESTWESMKEGVKDFFGVGPKGYRRSDERIREDVSDALTRDAAVDASQIEVEVKDGKVTLRGTVNSRWMKRRAEDAVEDVSGVDDVKNEIEVKKEGFESTLGRSSEKSGKSEQKKSA